jgi:hypothetical protein
MTGTLTWLDHARIEYAILRVDVMISALPLERQQAILGELRTNLRSASEQLGSAEALRRLGGLRPLARSYLDIEHGGPGPRPRWLMGILWVVIAEGVLLAVAFAGSQGFADGVLAADPHASGTYTWRALAPVAGSEDLVFSGGTLHGLGFTFSAPLLVAIGAAVFAVGARAWRCLPPWRHR